MKFQIANWPVHTPDAKAALAEIASTHFIRTPPIYDLNAQLVGPRLYMRRFRGAVVLLNFTFSCYKWPKKKTVFCADLAHLRVITTPSPLTPVTPRYKHTVDFDPEYPLYPLNLHVAKKAKLDTHEEGRSELLFLSESKLMSHTED